MRSRTLLSIVLLLAVVAPGPGAAEQGPKLTKIGLLTPSTQTNAAAFVQAFRHGLRELGHVEGKTFVLEVRYGEGKFERIPEIARELVGLKADVIVASTDPGIAAVRRETGTIPIVMAYSTDPVGTGFVASLAHPGGNVTGLSNVSPEMSGKRLGLLREVVPGLSRVAVLWSPDIRGAVFEYRETEAVARSLRLELQSLEVSSIADLDRAFSTMTSQRAQALILLPGNAIAVSKRADIVAFTLRNRLPSMYAAKEYVEDGGLVSYGPSIPAMYHRAATYVDKILKGAKPADLPVEQPITFELAINLKTARSLGLTIPQSFIQRADKVIQ